MNGLTTDLQRTCNGPASEGVDSSRRISLKPVLSLGDGFENVFYVLHLFSSILNKMIQPKINAYCYAIETINSLYSALQLYVNSFIIFTLGNYSQDLNLVQQAR